MTVRTIARAGALMICVIALTSCSGEAPSTVLQPDEVGSVDSHEVRSGVPRVVECADLGSAESQLTVLAAVDNADVWKGDSIRYTLKNAETVDSIVLPDNSSSDSAESMITNVGAAITSCAALPSSDPRHVGALTGLPDRRLGYRYDYDSGAERVVGERMFAIQGDRLVVVGAEHRGAGNLSSSVADLLPKALQRAKADPKS